MVSTLPAFAYLAPPCVAQDADGNVVSFFDWSAPIRFADPTDAYPHGVLGDAIEYRTLEIVGEDYSGDQPIGKTDLRYTLPPDRIFEDLSPRPFSATAQWVLGKTADLGGTTGSVVVVETDFEKGAMLAIYNVQCAGLKLVAKTAPIGTRFRWLAPAGIADFDGDGQNDIAYVETPHLGKILKIVTLKGDQLPQIVPPLAGFSNHKIGQDFITSGIRHCGPRPELLTPNADWTALMAVRVEAGEIVAEQTPFEPSLAGIAQAQRCED